ncbi:hypothetical protein EJB05_02620 [Eragrostis curvula]|uniref:Uncharacterized protein n=1 Tax=Eragrostis curvula TaxID=38414 RepID=A0A5J9WVA4_9POAL|nr:hypothetical protein EJB05_02620 [Eragrostis curvula]
MTGTEKIWGGTAEISALQLSNRAHEKAVEEVNKWCELSFPNANKELSGSALWCVTFCIYILHGIIQSISTVIRLRYL